MNNNELNISEQEPKEQTAKLLTDYTDTVARKTLFTADSQAKTLFSKRHPEDGEEEKEEAKTEKEPIQDRRNELFDPFSPESAHKVKRSLFQKWFGKMESDSLRKGSIGLISSILGTGILALPQGMAEYGWAAGIGMLVFAALCHIFSFYLMTYIQALFPESNSYTGIIQKIVGGVRSIVYLNKNVSVCFSDFSPIVQCLVCEFFLRILE